MSSIGGRERLQPHDEHVVVDRHEFITSLCEDLKASLFGLRPVRLSLAVEGHPISLVRAVPLGLIINELATNAFKHVSLPTHGGGDWVESS